MTPEQKTSFNIKRREYENRTKPIKKMTQEDVVSAVLMDTPSEWFYTWELMGSTKFGWLSHASHTTMRRMEQECKIQKAYIGKFVVYSSLGTSVPVQKEIIPVLASYIVDDNGTKRIITVKKEQLEAFFIKFPDAQEYLNEFKEK